MTNRVRARDLLWFTREVLEEMRRHRARGVWNGVVRRGQEVVENSLKAILLHLGAEYPRIHDPAPVLEEVVKHRGVPIDRGRLTWLRVASKELAEIRGPAAYVEMLCNEDQASRAAAAADEAYLLAVEICGAPPEGPFRGGS